MLYPRLLHADTPAGGRRWLCRFSVLRWWKLQSNRYRESCFINNQKGAFWQISQNRTQHEGENTMKLNTPKTKIGICTIITFCAVTVMNPIASASEPSNISPVDATSSQTVAVPAPISATEAREQSEQKPDRQNLESSGGDPRVEAYWTPERIAHAIPSTMTVFDSLNTDSSAITSGKTDNSSDRIVLSTPEQAAIRNNNNPVLPRTVTNWSKTNGKVLFTDQTNGLDYMCSGSSLNSGSKRLVITAGHCVHGGQTGTWHANWVFIPDYQSGSRPYGTFQAYSLRTFTD